MFGNSMKNFLKYTKNKTFLVNQRNFAFTKFNTLSNRKFSTRLERDKSDLFLNNITINNIPNNISTYNDLDMSMTTEIFKNIDMDNLCSLPVILGRFSRMFCIGEDFLHNISMFLSHDLGLGLGISTIIISLGLRLAFFKFNLKSQKNSKINRMLYVEKKEINDKLKTYKGSMLIVERKKISMIDEKFGINNRLSNIFTLFTQILLTMNFTCLLQRFCFHVEDYPEITYGGFLWFKDLSVIDPYYILPLFQVCLSILAIYSNTQSYNSNIGITLRRFIFIAPIISMPLMMTFEAGLLLYFCCVQINIIIFNNIVDSERGKKFFNIPSVIPGSVLEKMNPNLKSEIAQIRKQESNKINEEYKIDDKKDKLYETKLKITNKEVFSSNTSSTKIK